MRNYSTFNMTQIHQSDSRGINNQLEVLSVNRKRLSDMLTGQRPQWTDRGSATFFFYIGNLVSVVTFFRIV